LLTLNQILRGAPSSVFCKRKLQIMVPLHLARQLAQIVLAGRWSAEEIAVRLAASLDYPRPHKWMVDFGVRIVATFGDGHPPPLEFQLARFLAMDRATRRVESRLRGDFGELSPTLNLLDQPKPLMASAKGILATNPICELTTPGEIAKWLGITPSQLDWLADCQGRERQRPFGPLRHYHYVPIAERMGRKRLLEIPKTRLKQIQRSILNEILEHIPPHPAAHAFRSGRSTLTCAARHTGQRVVLRIDLREFFPSISSRRVLALFHTIGYPERVARLLTGLCTNTPPDEVIQDVDPDGVRTSPLAAPHLPQGAPTSPALANLCAFRLDCRLTGIARHMGITYTRYADDLVFSGDRIFERSLAKFRILVCAIVHNEGFQIRRRKTRVMRSGTRQDVAGIVVNRCPNVARQDYDQIKATLFNCIRFGPETQNRSGVDNFREHLLGRISYVQMIHPARGARLRALFDRIDWSH
jgi:retron-type reverse transcriptase